MISDASTAAPQISAESSSGRDTPEVLREISTMSGFPYQRVKNDSANVSPAEPFDGFGVRPSLGTWLPFFVVSD